jgi:hypothetical protein
MKPTAALRKRLREIEQLKPDVLSFDMLREDVRPTFAAELQRRVRRRERWAIEHVDLVKEEMRLETRLVRLASGPSEAENTKALTKGRAER